MPIASDRGIKPVGQSRAPPLPPHQRDKSYSGDTQSSRPTHSRHPHTQRFRAKYSKINRGTARTQRAGRLQNKESKRGARDARMRRLTSTLSSGVSPALLPVYIYITHTCEAMPCMRARILQLFFPPQHVIHFVSLYYKVAPRLTLFLAADTSPGSADTATCTIFERAYRQTTTARCSASLRQ